MWKSCAKCGKIHDYNKRCYAGDSFRKKDTKANKFRATTEWKNKSEEIREESKYLCAMCIEEGIYNYNQLEVHHIEPLEKNFERRLDDYNLICLCSEHHKLAERGEVEQDYLFNLVMKREEKNDKIIQ